MSIGSRSNGARGIPRGAMQCAYAERARNARFHGISGPLSIHPPVDLFLLCVFVHCQTLLIILCDSHTYISNPSTSNYLGACYTILYLCCGTAFIDFQKYRSTNAGLAAASSGARAFSDLGMIFHQTGSTGNDEISEWETSMYLQMNREFGEEDLKALEVL